MLVSRRTVVIEAQPSLNHSRLGPLPHGSRAPTVGAGTVVAASFLSTPLFARLNKGGLRSFPRGDAMVVRAPVEPEKLTLTVVSISAPSPGREWAGGNGGDQRKTRGADLDSTGPQCPASGARGPPERITPRRTCGRGRLLRLTRAILPLKWDRSRISSTSCRMIKTPFPTQQPVAPLRFLTGIDDDGVSRWRSVAFYSARMRGWSRGDRSTWSRVRSSCSSPDSTVRVCRSVTSNDAFVPSSQTFSRTSLPRWIA